MENPIKEKPYNIILGYDGCNDTRSDINTNAQDGIDTIVIGNLADITIAKTTEACVDKDIRNYIGTLNAYASKCNLTYIPGERDLQIYTALKDTMAGCRGRQYLSKVTSWKYASDIMKIAEKIKDARPELMGIYSELSDLAIHENDKFLYVIKSLIVLGKQPIYAIRKNEDGKYVQISHANPQGKIISEERTALKLAEDVITIEQVADIQAKLDQGSNIGSTHNNLKSIINSMLLKYLLDQNDPIRKKLSESLSDPYGGDR